MKQWEGLHEHHQHSTATTVADTQMNPLLMKQSPPSKPQPHHHDEQQEGQQEQKKQQQQDATDFIAAFLLDAASVPTPTPTKKKSDYDGSHAIKEKSSRKRLQQRQQRSTLQSKSEEDAEGEIKIKSEAILTKPSTRSSDDLTSVSRFMGWNDNMVEKTFGCDDSPTVTTYRTGNEEEEGHSLDIEYEQVKRSETLDARVAGIDRLKKKNAVMTRALKDNGSPSKGINDTATTTRASTSPKKQRSQVHPDYDLGMPARSRHDMKEDEDPDKTIDGISQLKKFDFAFVRRSNEQWTYSIISDRTDDSITFVVDEVGRIKTIPRYGWLKNICRIRLQKKYNDRAGVQKKRSRHPRRRSTSLPPSGSDDKIFLLAMPLANNPLNRQ